MVMDSYDYNNIYVYRYLSNNIVEQYYWALFETLRFFTPMILNSYNNNNNLICWDINA